MNAAHASLWRRLCYTRLSDLVRGRLDASLDWRVVVAAADLPPELAELVACVVRRTRLWRGERVDVARELVAHFQDGLAAGRTSQQLVQSFGDARQAARLIRRAKRRSRPLVWYVWRYGLWTLFVALLLYALAAMFLLHGEPIVNTDYLAELNADARDVAPDERAWPLYRRALLDLDCRPYAVDYEPTLADVALEARPGDARWPQAVAFLSEHQAELGQLRAAAARPHVGDELTFTIAPADRPLLGDPTPRAAASIAQEELGESQTPLCEMFSRCPYADALRTGARLLEADIYRAVEAGDAATAYADVAALLGMSRQLGEKPTIIGGLVACIVEGKACDAIEYVLTVNPTLWSDAQLVDLAHRLGARHINAAAALESERMSMHDIVQRLYTDDGHGDGTITYAGLKQFMDWLRPRESSVWTDAQYAQRDSLLAAGMPILAGVLASRAELEEQIDKLFAAATANLETPLWDEHGRMFDQLQLQIVRSDWSRIKYTPLGLMSPAVEPFRLQVERARGRAEGVMVGLALELYRRENGHWPESLDELSPRWLPAVPVDRINGGLLGYRIVDDRPIVYSLGADGGDDGGRLPFDRPEHAKSYPVGPPYPNAFIGDWVIWSTAPAASAPKWEEEKADAAD